ncbi:uncharacterized protein AB675_8960 [Cyphellophora attinorum]|uniref:Uncharacterized protein n=1 Tax=Cyphellophora attinorum TaxID=1664694 RepID=A0A0N1NXX7_9EURO|nr:uncharacterized protein AB675_8960 [Phialophora attinorum]KPI36223.1 hypothetical protein AB675_8960 [Phialophora attinorum]
MSMGDTTNGSWWLLAGWGPILSLNAWLQERPNRLWWVLVPAAVFVSSYALEATLHDVNRLPAAPHPDPAPTAQELDEDAEKHIPVHALKVLAESHSFELRKAAFNTVLNQSLQDGTRRLLLQDLAGKDPERREDAVRAFEYLLAGPEPTNEPTHEIRHRHRAQLHHFDTYEAIVSALVNLLPQHRFQPTPAQFSDPTTLIRLLVHLLRAHNHSPVPLPEGGISTVLAAGLVRRWLIPYPFPCALPHFKHINGNLHRSDVAELLTNHHHEYVRDDPLMSALFTLLSQNPESRLQLQQAGLAKRKSRLKEDLPAQTDSTAEGEDAREEEADPVPDEYRPASPHIHPAPDPALVVDEMAARRVPPPISPTTRALSAWRSFNPPAALVPPAQERVGTDLTRPGDAEGEVRELEAENRRRNREAVVYTEEEDMVAGGGSGGGEVVGDGARNEDGNENGNESSGSESGSGSGSEEAASRVSFSPIDSNSASPPGGAAVPAPVASAASPVLAGGIGRAEFERRLAALQSSSSSSRSSNGESGRAGIRRTSSTILRAVREMEERDRAVSSGSGSSGGGGGGGREAEA